MEEASRGPAKIFGNFIGFRPRDRYPPYNQNKQSQNTDHRSSYAAPFHLTPKNPGCQARKTKTTLQ